MPNKQETKTKGFQFSGVFKDLVLLVAVTVLILLISYFFNIFGIIVEFLHKHPDKILYIDEVITTLLTLSIGLVVFAWRRWLDLKRETTERIKSQEELIRITTTQAETERIINKQLHIDMDEMKQDLREILHLLLNKQKKTT